MGAFLLSLVTAVANVWQAFRASEVTVQPIDEIYLYRDHAVLTAAVRLTLVNKASANFGDVVTEVRLAIIGTNSPDRPVFVSDLTATPVYSEDSTRLVRECPPLTRCVRNGRFVVTEEHGRAFDVPGGSSRTQHIGFVLFSTYCAEDASCQQYTSFDNAISQLQSEDEILFQVSAVLASDGTKIQTCRVRTQGTESQFRATTLARHLATEGWVALGCD